MWDAVQFWIRQTHWTPDRTIVSYAQSLEFKTLKSEDEGKELPCAFVLGREQAQQFMDELWRAGFRPTEGTGSAGALAAVEKHLADMRALVFKKEPKGF